MTTSVCCRVVAFLAMTRAGRFTNQSHAARRRERRAVAQVAVDDAGPEEGARGDGPVPGRCRYGATRWRRFRRALRPKFEAYHAIVLNYDAPDDRWPDALKRAFESYVTNGGGVVVVHAANNAFPGWPAYNEMIGIGGWRGRTEKAGPYWFFKDGHAAV